ncbi:Potassium transporter 11 [Linum perenne]
MESLSMNIEGGIDGDSESNKGSMWVLDQKLDQSMDEEAGKLKNMYREKKFSSLLLLRLAFQSLGVVYGDLGTSPLYVFYNTFPNGISDPEDVIGALSLIIYSLTLVPLIKYVFIVCRANDNGQGGTLALYSLLCRHAKVKTIPNQHRTDEDLTTYSRSTFHEQSFAAKTKRWLEGHACRKTALLILVLVGTCMVIGDGILTPAISVLSAAGGIKVNSPKVSNDIVILVAVVILVGLFSMQHYGTDKVGLFFAPIVLLWFLLIGGIGIYNICKYDKSVLKAFSPVYVYRYLKRGRREGFLSLGGIMLSITGTEALFADLAHFPVAAIQLAFTVVVFPCLLLAYSGQAAYLMKNQEHVVDAFYRSIPDKIYWPVFVVATAAAIVASQATISATFSIIKQANAHGCFPRVKVVHTSKKFLGQIYVPDINWILMILCICVTAGFRKQSQIGNAYGTAVVIVMLVTTLLMVLIMILVWRSHWILVVIFTTLSLIVECTYFSAVLFKINQGGWVPLVIAGVFLIIMYVWHYGTVKRYEFEMHSKVSMAWIIGLGPSLGLVRVPGVPGIGLVYTKLVSGVPHIFSHFITNLPAIHTVVIFICIKYLPVCTVPQEERFLVRRIGPKDFHMFRCVARYGYRDLHKKDDDFESRLFESIFRFVRLDSMMDMEYSTEDDYSFDENDFPDNDQDTTVDHMPQAEEVEAREDSGWRKRVAIDYVYALLRKLSRENSVLFNIPRESSLNVGQVISV